MASRSIPQIIKHLRIDNCPNFKILDNHPILYLTIKNNKVFDLSNIQIVKNLHLFNVEIILGLSKLVTQKINISVMSFKNEDISSNRLLNIIPEIYRLQVEADASLKDKKKAMWEFQDILIEAGFSEEEYQI